MKLRAVPLVAVGIAGLFLASAVGAVVVDRDDDAAVRTDASTTSTFPSFVEETTTIPELDFSGTAADPNLSAPLSPPASVAPVQVPATATTTSTVAAAAAPAPVLAVGPAPCQTPPSQPAANAPAGPTGVFAAGVGDGVVRLTNPIGRLPAWRPKTGQVVSVATASGKPPGLCLSGPDGGGAKAITTPVGVGRPALSADGARVAVRSGRAGAADLVAFSVEAADQKLLLTSTEVGDPVWLGNGSAVIVCAAVGGARRLVSVPAGGGDPRTLRDTCPTSPVSSAPDGGRIAFSQGNQLTVLTVGTRSTVNLTVGTALATASAPTWSPDGKRLAFAFSDAQGVALGVLDLDAGRAVTPFRSPGLATPAWSPAGDLIAFTGNEGTGQALLVVKPDGTGRRVIAPCQTRCSLAAQPWATDNSFLILELSGAAA